MKILRESIRLILREAERSLDEAMKTEPPEGYRIQVSGSDRSIRVEIKPQSGRSPLGVMIISRGITSDSGDLVWEVSNAEVGESGYGPLLYDIAMELISLLGDGGLMPDRVEVSSSARNVWKRYYEDRSDIEKTALPEDMFQSERMRDRPEYMRYYYSKPLPAATPILSNLNQKGLIDADQFKSLDLPAYLD